MQKAVGAAEAHESIGRLKDVIFLTRVRIVTEHKALGANPISFRGERENVEKVSPNDELGRV
jgi:hypothetical protein